MPAIQHRIRLHLYYRMISTTNEFLSWEAQYYITHSNVQDRAKQLIEENLNDVFIFVVFIFVVDDCEQRVLANNKNEF